MKLPRDAGMFAAGLSLLVVVVVLSQILADDAGEMLTRNTIRLSLAWYTLTLCLMMQLERTDWRADTALGKLTRWCWSWALACFLVHLVAAFHFYHHWSHADAFERTRQVSGTGQGVYVSYLFTLLWTMDITYWWLWPARYAARSSWVDRLLHGFMLFMVFNGTIVYESGAIRWAGILMFALLAAVWGLRKSKAPR